ncbi:MAG: PIG-L deacetylase family protein [Mucilaginibacter sp.]
MRTSNSRRNFVKTTAAGLSLLTLPNLLQAKAETLAEKKKIICFGGHPDDPECGCGGTLARLANHGHEVTIIYLTTGEAGIAGRSHNEAAAIRKQESINACAILKAKPVFVGQIDADTIMDNSWLAKVQKLVADEKPDLVITHWPIDSHKDHQITSLLMIQTWIRSSQKFPLYFFETCTGSQTMGFHPTDYVDITATQEQKRKAVYCHVSQDPPSLYGCGHAVMEDFRGRELGVTAAEAFIFMTGKTQGSMIGLM